LIILTTQALTVDMVAQPDISGKILGHKCSHLISTVKFMICSYFSNNCILITT